MYFASALIRKVNVGDVHNQYPGAIPNNAISISPIAASRYDQIRPCQEDSTPWILFDDPVNCDLQVVPQYAEFAHSFDNLSIKILDIISKIYMKELTVIVENPVERPPYIGRIGCGKLRNYTTFLERP